MYVDTSDTCLHSESSLLTDLTTDLILASTLTPVQICFEVNSCKVSFGRIFFFFHVLPSKRKHQFLPKVRNSNEPLGVVFLNMAISIVAEARNSNLSWNIWVLLGEENKLYLFKLLCFQSCFYGWQFLWNIVYLSHGNPFFLHSCLPSHLIHPLNLSDVRPCSLSCERVNFGNLHKKVVR